METAGRERRLLLRLVEATGFAPAAKAALRRFCARGAGALAPPELREVEEQAMQCSPRPGLGALRAAGDAPPSLAEAVALLQSLTDSAPERALLARVAQEAARGAQLEAEFRRVSAGLRRSPAPDDRDKENGAEGKQRDNLHRQTLNALAFEHKALCERIDALRRDILRLRGTRRDWELSAEARLVAAAQRIAASQAAGEDCRKAERKLEKIIAEKQLRLAQIARESEGVAAGMRHEIKLHGFLKRKTEERNVLQALDRQIDARTQELGATATRREEERRVSSAARSRHAIVEKIEGAVQDALGLKSFDELQGDFALLHEKQLGVEKLIADLREEAAELDKGLSALETRRNRKFASQPFESSCALGSAEAVYASNAQKTVFLEDQTARNEQMLCELQRRLGEALGDAVAVDPQQSTLDASEPVKGLLNALEARIANDMATHCRTIAVEIGPHLARPREEVEEQLLALFGAFNQEPA